MTHFRNQPLPDGITSSYLIDAARLFDEQGMPNGYKASHSYDVEIAGKLYPPPAIVALAGKVLTGNLPQPGFRAGKGTKYFQILEDAGFVTRRKTEND